MSGGVALVILVRPPLGVEKKVEARDGRLSVAHTLFTMVEKRDQDSDFGTCMAYESCQSSSYLTHVSQDNAGKTTLLYRLKVQFCPLGSCNWVRP